MPGGEDAAVALQDAAVAQLKQTRGHKKSVVTKCINSVARFIAEDNVEQVKTRVQQLKESFLTFEGSHDEYHAALQSQVELSTSDQYFSEAQSAYVQSLREAKAWLAAAVPSTQAATSSTAMDMSSLMSLMNLPKVELEAYDGDPTKYHTFIAVFNEAIGDVLKDDKLKLTRLLQYTTGLAKEAIRSCVLAGSSGYQEALNILKRRFGSDHLICERIVSSLRQGKSIRTAAELQHLADELLSAYMTLGEMSGLQEVNNQSVIVEIVERLQSHLKFKWRKEAMEFKRKHDQYPQFKHFVEFMRRQAEEMNDPVYGQLGSRENSDKSSKTGKHASSFSSHVQDYPERKSQRCVMCREDHRLWYCQSFKDLKPFDRLQVVRKHNLCENCLLSGHKAAFCRKPSVCSVEGCGKKHTKFVHVTPRFRPSDETSVKATVNVGQRGHGGEVCMPIVQVRVNGKQEVCALLDTASSNTFCSRALANSLGLVGKKVSFQLNTLSHTFEHKTGQSINMELTTLDSSRVLPVSNVFIVDHIPAGIPTDSVFKYPHLRDLPLVTGVEGVHILIGQDNSEALVPMAVRKGKSGEPFAVETLFGWVVNGPLSFGRVNHGVISNFVETLSIQEGLDRLWDLEIHGLQNESRSLSVQDRKVLDLWDKELKVVNGHYELPIPWKPNVSVPNNHVVAVSRLNSLKKSLEIRGLFERYNEEIVKLLKAGYAEPAESIQKVRTWFLPHHAVVTAKKPGKVRVVYDCASKYKGEGLNDKAYQGPDLNNHLLDVLLRFRQGKYAVQADVEAMYYQVLIPEHDRNSLCFLWFDNNGDVVTYRMTRHVFGGVWCASSATYALRRTIVDNPNVDSLVSDTVLRSFYVDDCLRSLDDKAEITTVIQGTRAVLQSGGFKLTKFVANDQDLLECVPESDRAVEVRDLNHDFNSKVLGIGWNVSKDEFYFNVEVDVHVPATRRNMLSTVASMFDPLGLVSPILVKGKVLFQDATRRSLSWDEPVQQDLQVGWSSWLTSLQDVRNISVPRRVVEGSSQDVSMELHHFSDASELAYGCCSYLRSVSCYGHVNVALLFSKCRVAPIKTTSIPRLELQAAVLAAQTDALLREQLDFSLLSSHFWVDSELVLKYLFNESQRFHVYVANRVGKIHSLTKTTQWHHIAGKDNPADMISRGLTPVQLTSSKWFQGPDFLKRYKSEWVVKDMVSPLSNQDPGVKVRGFVACAKVEVDCVGSLLDYHSGWLKLKRTVAWYLRLKSLLLKRQPAKQGKFLQFSELQEAELAIVRFVQRRFFGSELKELEKSGRVSASSKILSLDPTVDSNGILRVGGRLAHSALSEDSRNPIIIPHDHHIAGLIARDYHEQAHVGVEWVVARIRTRFWITRIRNVVKRVVHGCMKCRKLFSTPCEQKMADLPAERLESSGRPFQYVGIDCFGPYMVRQGRSEVKRYGCIFSCLVTRAVHLEKLNSMDTDSFLNAFRRFVSRRGTPVKVWSDNGTNFVGAKAELDRNFKDVVHEYSVSKSFEWVFNPPHASHWGGCWERMIRTVRKVFLGVLNSGVRLTDEILETLFCEVESIINGRPITKVGSDVNDGAPLTPNHLLVMDNSSRVPPGVFNLSDVYRRRWKCVQSLSEQFWRKWLAQYIPQLQHRHKWTKQTRSVQVGDLVLLVGENTPRFLWPMGLVQEIFSGKDGLVRSCKVKTKGSIFVRPITKIVLLEGHDEIVQT